MAAMTAKRDATLTLMTGLQTIISGRSVYSCIAGRDGIVTVVGVRKAGLRADEGVRPTGFSVLGHPGIDAICPGQYPASQIVHLLEACLLEEGHCFGAPHAGAAVGHDLAAGIEFVHALGQITQRDQVPVDVADLILMRLTHVEHEKILARIQTPLELFDLYFGNACFHWFLLALFFTANSTKLVVVYQFCDGAMRPAGRTVGILAQLELAELHAKRIDEQQPPDEWVTLAKDQLDDFSRLNHTDQSGQNAQHSTFGAGGNQPRRRWLGIQAPVAWAILRSENTGLSLKPEN